MKRTNMRRFSYWLLTLLFGCGSVTDSQTTNSPNEAEATGHHSPTLKKVFDAHGGFNTWNAMQQLSYTKDEEQTVTDLKNRKIRVSTSEKTIGFDGTDVWVTPDTVDASNARFYHNLFFYFYAMPFVLGDPGISYEDVEPREFEDKELGGIKISYASGVGDSPKDNYIIWYDPETYRMEWLMYTVTYRSGRVSESYNLIKYDQWQEVNGVLLPYSLQWRRFKEGKIGAIRRELAFKNVTLSQERPDQQLFTKPADAQIAPYKK